MDINYRHRKPKLVVAFKNTGDAFDFEDVCTLGRIIPLPPEIQAGCGFAYAVDMVHKTAFEKFLQDYPDTTLHEINMY